MWIPCMCPGIGDFGLLRHTQINSEYVLVMARIMIIMMAVGADYGGMMCQEPVVKIHQRTDRIGEQVSELAYEALNLFFRS